MNLPRLIIADEHRPGKVPSGVLIATALKDMGYKLRLFVGSVDETVLRSLQLLCNQPVTLLDPILCDRRANLRWLFQNTASPDCLNLILTNLGGRLLEDSAFRIPKECLLLADWLKCDVLPVIYSDMSSVIVVRTITEVIRQLEAQDTIVHTALFRSILNNREYELLDREVGRQISAFSIGSMPKMLERDQPIITDLCGENAKSAVFPLRSAALQLKSMDQQVNWPVFYALGTAAPTWEYQTRQAEQITDAGEVNIAVIRHPALTLGGNGTEELMKALGCNMVDVPLDGDLTHRVAIHGIYIPHGLAFMALPKFFSNLYLKTMILRGASGQSFLLAEGGSAPLLGNRIIMPTTYGGEGRGFGVLPFNSVYKAATFGAPHRVVATRKTKNPIVSGSQEWVWGYTSPNLAISSDADDDEPCLRLSDSITSKPKGEDGWCKGRVLATAMRMEPWSTPDTFRRWLEG